MNNELVLAALTASACKESTNAARLLEQGVEFEKDSDTVAVPSALLETYESRLEHLARFQTHHAERLKAATHEFCETLTGLTDEQAIAYGRLDDTLLGSYIVWYIQSDQRVVGCLYVIGKSEVEEAVWEQLWEEST